MPIGLALLVSADPVTIQQFSRALQELSILSDVCQEVPAAVGLLNRQKFDAVIVDLQIGEQSGMVLEEARLSPANRTAVTFAISGSDAEAIAFRKKSGFVFERPLSTQSIHKTLKPAYGLILRERRRYFRCPLSVPVVILRRGQPEVRCNSVNVSEGGMALNTLTPLHPEEKVQVQFTLPGLDAPFKPELTICWWKAGQVGVRFVALSQEQESALQGWLSRKLEEMLPEFVAGKFRRTEVCSPATNQDRDLRKEVRCPYCVGAYTFFPMQVLSNGRLICEKCGHIVFPDDTAFRCPCTKCIEIAFSARIHKYE
ncbi:MAG: PilZ domain-containing protein [Candidatus Sulfotelmatobacter sp.]|jgi:ActR/RegA family two-component response regulator